MGRLAPAAAIALLTGLVLVSTAARGERVQVGNLILSINGGISPRKLPRDRPAPVAVRLSGSIHTADGSSLPRVKRIELSLAGRGLIFTRGLAVCPRARLRNADSRQALARCGDALVGRGSLDAQIFVPRQAPFMAHGRLLAFNGRTGEGDTAVWVHTFAANPPTSIVLPFVVHRRSGAFRTALVAKVPRSTGPLAHVASFDMTFSRRFTYRGRPRSYLSATCPAPPRFTAGFLSLARATYSFDRGLTGRVETVRSCRAR